MLPLGANQPHFRTPNKQDRFPPVNSALTSAERKRAMKERRMVYNGVWRGVVTNARDPLMQARLQVSVPDIATAAMWAAPCRPFGSTALPPVGTPVWVMFERGNLSYPVWIGCRG